MKVDKKEEGSGKGEEIKEEKGDEKTRKTIFFPSE